MTRLPYLFVICWALDLAIASTSMGAEVDVTRPIQLSGIVLDSDGEPSVARVRVISVSGEECVTSQSNSKGEFAIDVRLADVITKSSTKNWQHGVLCADSEGSCPSWIALHAAVHEASINLRLVEDLPIRASVLDVNGQPVANARVRIHSVHRFPSENLDAYLKTFRDRVTTLDRMRSKHAIYAPAGIWAKESELSTDNNGEFILSGIGKERVVRATIEGESIAGQLVSIITRPQIEAKWKRTKLSRFDRMNSSDGAARIPIVYAANFRHVATPAGSISGLVTARDSGKPLANVRISAQMSGHGGQATTDEQGRYTVQGLPTEGTVNLFAICPDGMAYVNAERRGNEYNAASPPENTNFQLSPGVMARGKVVDSAGKPIRARVDYLCLRDNKYASEMADKFGAYGDCWTDDEGNFEIVVVPGKGLLTVNAKADRYARASFDGLGLPLIEGRNRGMLSTINWGIVRGENYHAVQLINPKSLTDEVDVRITLNSGNRILGELLDSKGQPVRKATWSQPDRNYDDVLQSHEFTIEGLKEDEVRRIVFRHNTKRLGAVVHVDAKTRSPLQVKMRPYATISGRIINKQGQPLAKAPFSAITAGAIAELQLGRKTGLRPVHRPVVFGESETDADGRFRISEIIPGHKCELVAAESGARERQELPTPLMELTLRSGETRDLGDVVLE